MNGSASQPRQEFRHARTSMGATGHWLKMAGIMAPLVIGEVVKDSEKRWRWTRIAAVATAALAEGLWIHHVNKQREEGRELGNRARN